MWDSSESDLIDQPGRVGIAHQLRQNKQRGIYSYGGQCPPYLAIRRNKGKVFLTL